MVEWHQRGNKKSKDFNRSSKSQILISDNSDLDKKIPTLAAKVELKAE